jgi:uncharacterized membrane protein YphA (DoxX/SURF4 family)
MPIGLGFALLWPRFERWKPWADTLIRWYLASMLFSYGFSKFRQFPPLTPLRLHEPFGQASPMGLLWSFMGASRPYTAFAGAMEAMAGILLLLPLFSTLGAALAFGVMTNVFLLNMCYDVPVKLFSLQLLLFSLWILAADHERVLKFIRGRPVQEIKFPNSKVWIWSQLLAACLIFGKHIPWSDHAQDAPFPGTWVVEQPEHSPWIRMVFDFKYRMTFQTKEGGTVRFHVTAKEPEGTYEIQSEVNKVPSQIHIDRIDQEHLKVSGEINGQSADLSLRLEPTLQYPLLSRGFHWVNEFPFNN